MILNFMGLELESLRIVIRGFGLWVYVKFTLQGSKDSGCSWPRGPSAACLQS